MVGSVKDLWGHVRGPQTPPPPWPSASDGLTNGAKVAGPNGAGNGGPTPDAGPNHQEGQGGRRARRPTGRGRSAPRPPHGVPGMTQPGMTQPGMTQPGMTQPGMSQPGGEASPPAGSDQAGGQDPADEQPGGGGHS